MRGLNFLILSISSCEPVVGEKSVSVIKTDQISSNDETLTFFDFFSSQIGVAPGSSHDNIGKSDAMLKEFMIVVGTH